MLNNNTLSQLKQLKQQIEDQKEYAIGIIKGTQRKFGFVVLEDGREIFLSPDEMQKVFPGDKVKILIKPPKETAKDKKAKASCTLENLIESSLKEFTGRYVIKGKGHFVEPDLPRINRLIFIPPSARKNAQAGDYISCKITRHPYPQGKPQVKILQVIGAEDKAGIEADYMSCKFQLAPAWPKDWQQQLQSVDTTNRTDLSHINFITIDNSDTLDMDDALYAEPTSTGWQLQVAIADPYAIIKENSELDKIIHRRAISTYLPGQTVSMMPEELSHDRCSLMPELLRPALVCNMTINHDGTVSDYSIIEAMVRSKSQLNYNDVSNFIGNKPVGNPAAEPNNCDNHGDLLKTLQALSCALHQQRKAHHLIIPSRQEFNLVLNNQRKIERIELKEKNAAQQLVEECMVAANRCAADMLGYQGLFISHPGFRKERLPDVKKLAEEQLNLTDIDFATPQGYQQLINSINDESLDFPLRAVLSRLLERSQLSETPQPHYGMGLSAYTTFTSPIRKCSDLIVQRILKKKIAQQEASKITTVHLEQIQNALNNSRQARNQMEQWLKCQYAKPLIEKSFSGEVIQINSNGFTVRLNDNYIEGFIDTRILSDKYSFDPMRLRLSSKTQTIELQKQVAVKIKEVDCKQRSILLSLEEAVGE